MRDKKNRARHDWHGFSQDQRSLSKISVSDVLDSGEYGNTLKLEVNMALEESSTGMETLNITSFCNVLFSNGKGL